MSNGFGMQRWQPQPPMNSFPYDQPMTSFNPQFSGMTPTDLEDPKILTSSGDRGSRSYCSTKSLLIGVVLLIVTAAAGGGAAIFLTRPGALSGLATDTGNGTTTTPTLPVTTASPTSKAPTLQAPTASPSHRKITSTPTFSPSNSPSKRTSSPITTPSPTLLVTNSPVTPSPITKSPTTTPTTSSPATSAPITFSPTSKAPTTTPTTSSPATSAPITSTPTSKAPTLTPTTISPSTSAPISSSPTTQRPTSKSPTTKSPTSAPVLTKSPTPPTNAPTGTPTSPTAFNIQLIFLTTLSEAEAAAFTSAKRRWEEIITLDIASTIVVPVGLPICEQPAAPVEIPIDDLLIYVEVKPIDGVNNILGSAGPCGFDDAGRVRLGKMTFDSADTANMVRNGQLNSVILHEMGHVLGLGTRWDANNLISPETETVNIRYFGANGNQGNTEIGGVGQAIIEQDGGEGTKRGHWDEETYFNELMTGFISGSTQPLSRLKARALVDLGYTIDVTKSDTFSISSGRRLRNTQEEAEGIRLTNDIYQGPLVFFNESTPKPGREEEHAHAVQEFRRKNHHKKHT